MQPIFTDDRLSVGKIVDKDEFVENLVVCHVGVLVHKLEVVVDSFELVDDDVEFEAPRVARGMQSALDAVEPSMKDAKIVSILVMMVVFSTVDSNSIDGGSCVMKLSSSHMLLEVLNR